MPASLFCLTDRRHLPYIPPSVCIPVAVVVIIITFGGDAIKYLRETKTQLLHHRLIIMCTYIWGAINAAVICKYQRQLSWPANFHSAIRNQTSYVAVHLHHLQQKRQRVRPSIALLSWPRRGLLGPGLHAAWELGHSVEKRGMRGTFLSHPRENFSGFDGRLGF